jgi:hypothetical protein
MFKLYKYTDQHPEMEYYQMTSAEAAVIGARYQLSAGYPTLAASTLAADLIAQKSLAASTAATRALVPFIRVRNTDIYETEATTGYCVGTTDRGLFIDGSTNGLKVHVTSSGASIQVVAVDGSTVLGNTVYVRLNARTT